jgi:hypothetical protein
MKDLELQDIDQLIAKLKNSCAEDKVLLDKNELPVNKDSFKGQIDAKKGLIDALEEYKEVLTITKKVADES